ncbi:F-box/WD repeat-containing protein 4-like isoform X2 [Ostrea edulis]|uniref:F-box/WD repeat-containing protein 4-like isoform X2 n=1 Tax=Ostrea edulis TaxID=37623 RepID=UPI0024AF6BE8|nr:F-box/WD repeat-containing protein 4-like isoform X2 [Ostrea edulis]
MMNGTAYQSGDENSIKIIVSFLDLPDDVLFSIFRRLDLTSLSVLCRVCHKLNDLLNSDYTWMFFAENFNVLRSINDNVFSLKEKCRISQNRENGTYYESLLTNFSGRQLPWVQYHDGKVLVSSKNVIQTFNPVRGKRWKVNKTNSLYKLQRDVTKFVIKEERIVSGCLDGSIHVWESNGAHTVVTNAHSMDTQAVDCHKSIVVSGSRDATVKVFGLQSDGHSGIAGVEEKCCLPVGDRVWTLSLSPCGRQCAVCTLGSEYKVGAGVLDMQYENEHILLTCGYDTFVRMWDLRINKCVCAWEQKFDCAYYCLRSDGHRNIFAGTSRHGSIDLWDKRHAKSPVQAFYIGYKNSPVYSLTFDSNRLYAALDVQVKFLDFSRYK